MLILLAIKATLIPLLTVDGSGSPPLNTCLWKGLVSGTAFIGVLLEIIMGFLIAILANMAYHNEFKAAFRFKEFFGVIKKIGGGGYFICMNNDVK